MNTRKSSSIKKTSRATIVKGTPTAKKHAELRWVKRKKFNMLLSHLSYSNGEQTVYKTVMSLIGVQR